MGDVLPVPPYLIFNELLNCSLGKNQKTKLKIFFFLKPSYQTLGLHAILRVLSGAMESSQTLEFMTCGFNLQLGPSSAWPWVRHLTSLTSVSSAVK